LRTEYSSGANSVISGALDPFRAKDAAIIQRQQWAAIPRQPGGAPPPPLISRLASSFRQQNAVAGITCVEETCGGPLYCVHRFLEPISTRAMLTCLQFDVSEAISADQQPIPAKTCIEALIRAKANPADWPRCGADAERLAALGYTVEALVQTRRIPFDDLVAGLQLTWDKLLVLGWNPSLLRHKDAFPVVSLVKPPISMTAMQLLGTFEMTYDSLYRMGITTEELCAMGFRAPMLAHIGMQKEHVVAALCQQDVIDRGGVAWYCKATGLSKTLFAALPASPGIISEHRELQSTYASLVLHFSKQKP